MKTLLAIAVLTLGSTTLFSQTSESLKARIQEHYKAIHSGSDTLWSHHLDDFTIFPSKGQALYESGFQKTYKNMGATMKLPKPNVIMKHFSSQIYDNVGVATFYLDGSYGEDHGLFRVTAVWVWKDGAWLEAHHHESKLIN
ncbi:hypothetical protein [Snuella lapsa]|uniref:DUF4440 domain-containing protein n=1 Tax=Snuella lapsa TaxID=870481 RepID=A0ABP6YEL3_9FLAO